MGHLTFMARQGSETDEACGLASEALRIPKACFTRNLRLLAVGTSLVGTGPYGSGSLRYRHACVHVHINCGGCHLTNSG